MEIHIAIQIVLSFLDTQSELYGISICNFLNIIHTASHNVYINLFPIKNVEGFTF